MPRWNLSRHAILGSDCVRGAGHPVTPDGRYFIVRGRLWRMSNPGLSEEERAVLVTKLMDARRAVGAAEKAGDAAGEKSARAHVDAATRARRAGPVWWRDGAPDLNRHMVRNTPYSFAKNQPPYAALGGIYTAGIATELTTASATELLANLLICNDFKRVVGETGFEPATSCSQSRRATGLRHSPVQRAPK